MDEYDKSFKLPAPVIEKIYVKDIGSSGIPEEIRGKIDTGSDVSCIPKKLYERLNPSTATIVHVKAFNESSYKEEYAWYVQLSFKCSNSNFECTVAVMTFDREYMVVGRDILNELTEVKLRGKERKFEIIK
jgi:hypothetical protein